ncbi:unnamed protein product [Camellia sinensis]
MDAVAFYPGFHLPAFSVSGKPKLAKPFFSLKGLFNLAEIADGPSLFASRKNYTRLTVLSIRADGNRRGRHPQEHIATGRTEKTHDENKISQSSDGKTSNSKNQEEIIALFRRIQSSISKGDSISPKMRSSNASQDNTSAESVLEVLRQSRKQVKECLTMHFNSQTTSKLCGYFQMMGGNLHMDQTTRGEKTSKKEGNRASTRRRELLQKDQKVQEYPSPADLQLTRPPSNFVKRSPIPFAFSSRKEVVEQKIEANAATAGEEIASQNLEDMKLSELKELAKTRGIKGYSKVRKSELVELLRS